MRLTVSSAGIIYSRIITLFDNYWLPIPLGLFTIVTQATWLNTCMCSEKWQMAVVR